MKQPFFLGLTGPTGAGKSSVAALLAARGFFVIDGDVVARQVMSPGSPLLPQLEAAFGGILCEDGSLNRKALAKKAFAAPDATARLNAITHPVILKEIENQARDAFSLGYTKIVVDAAALFESGGYRMCNKTAAVLAPWPERLVRIMARDGITEEEALTRIRGQKAEDYYASLADFILTTTQGAPNEPLVEQLLQKLNQSEN